MRCETENLLRQFFFFLLFYIHSVLDHVRGKAKKAMGSSRNPPKHPRPKHRGWKVQDGHYVSQGTILATQRTLRWFPGLNVSIDRMANDLKIN